MTYGKMHRFFLRTVASQGVISINDAQAALERFNDEEQLLPVTDLVKAINDEIRSYYQEIKITQDEATNEDVLVFLSLADDAATKAQNIFSSTELEYFRMLIEHIMSTESRQITKINAMNLVSSMKSNFTKTDAQKVLNTWCRMRYLDKVQDNYALGVRAIHEFEGYFLQNMPHAVEECFLCKHVVFRGYNCPGCAQAIHTKCLLRYIERIQNWPCCKIDFNQEQLERLDTEGSRLQPTSQVVDTTRQSEENNTVAEPTQASESSELMEETQEVIPEISQRLTRKRKRQISPQTIVPSARSTSSDTVGKPIRKPTTDHSSEDNIGEELAQVSDTARSTKEIIVEGQTQVSNKSHSKSNNPAVKPSQVPTRRSTRNNTVTEVQESFKSLDMTDKHNLETTQRVTRKRKQQL